MQLLIPSNPFAALRKELCPCCGDLRRVIYGIAFQGVEHKRDIKSSEIF